MAHAEMSAHLIWQGATRRESRGACVPRLGRIRSLRRRDEIVTYLRPFARYVGLSLVNRGLPALNRVTRATPPTDDASDHGRHDRMLSQGRPPSLECVVTTS